MAVSLLDFLTREVYYERILKDQTLRRAQQ